MISPIPIGQIKDFTLPNDKKDPTIWKIGVLDSIVKTLLMSRTLDIKIENSQTKSYPTAATLELDIDILRFGLKGWQNFKLNGKDVEIKKEKENLGKEDYDVLSRDSIKFIPRGIITTLANEIYISSEVSDDEEKN